MNTPCRLVALFVLAALSSAPSPAQIAAPAPAVLPTPVSIDTPAVPEVTVSATTAPGTLIILEPPAEDAAEPERIVHYFCRAWKDWDFKAMYGAMSSDYRDEVPYRRFEALFKGDLETNGGLLDESIAAESANAGAAVRLTVTLRFRSARAAPRTVVAVAVREGGDGWRIAESGIIPFDLDDL